MNSCVQLYKYGLWVLLISQIFFFARSTAKEGQSICATRYIKCKHSKYRSYDGSCNNLKHPQWGVPFSRYHRILRNNYADGLRIPAIAKNGSPLPSARKISSIVYPDLPIKNPCFTLITMQYGQVLAHDMSLAMDTTQTVQLLRGSDQCCSIEGKLKPQASNDKTCFQIDVPNDDPDFSVYGTECFQFSRSGTDLQYGCGQPDKPIEQLSRVTHFVDLSLVYGQNETQNTELRLFKGGKLKYEERNGQVWLPHLVQNTNSCTLVDPKEPCYRAGDPRVNQNPHLAILQTLLLREHNRIATELGKLNDHWKDERIFQETRKIMIGIHQKIVYYDLLPLLLGRENMLKKKLIYTTDGFVNDYNEKVNPNVMNEHATASFRLFHSNIAGLLELRKQDRETEDDVLISDSFNRPKILEETKSTFDELAIGLVTQKEYKTDEFHDKEITNNWSRLPNKTIGLDLKSICIQRSRDHGLATYNDFREYCGLPRAKKFSDFLDVMCKENVEKLSQLYNEPDDVDATVGGSLEILINGTMAGPTFLCITTEQFYRTRVGDRYFFEHSKLGFKLAQLKEIRMGSIFRLLCDNAKVEKMQQDAFRIISPENPLKKCSDLPSVDLSLWKEHKL